VTVVIPVFHGKPYLERCFRSVLATDYANMEIVVVDSSSTDGSVEYVSGFRNRSRHDIVTIRLNHNPGVCAARNVGAGCSTGQILAYIDQDSAPEPDWLKSAVSAFLQDERLGLIQCKLVVLNEDSTIDSLGYYLDKITLFPVQLVPPGVVPDRGDLRSRYIFGAKGAGMLVRKKVFDLVGGFDEGFFFWYEENDLCWRIWKSGYSIMLVPGSTVYHMWGSRRRSLPREYEFTTFFYAPRNYMMTVLKNGEFSQLPSILVHFSCWVGSAIVAVLRRRPVRALLILKALFWIAKNFRSIVSRRRMIPIDGRVPDDLYVNGSRAYLDRISRYIVG
jgi:hypothetical protein